jgi:undecaprenyl-diphosphatase
MKRMRAWLPGLLKGDERALLYLMNGRHPRLDRLVRGWTHLGGAATTIGATTLLLLSPSPDWKRAGLIGAATLASSHLAVQLLKRTVSRPRPQLPVGIAALIEPPDRFSFPSGHAAAALSVALAAAAVVPAGLAPWLVGAALLVGVTRCYLGVHYPGDVLAGWVLAGAAFTAAVYVQGVLPLSQ